MDSGHKLLDKWEKEKKLSIVHRNNLTLIIKRYQK